LGVELARGNKAAELVSVDRAKLLAIERVVPNKKRTPKACAPLGVEFTFP